MKMVGMIDRHRFYKKGIVSKTNEQINVGFKIILVTSLIQGLFSIFIDYAGNNLFIRLRVLFVAVLIILIILKELWLNKRLL